MTADEIIDDILRREGSEYTNRRTDRGGPTKYGITLRTLADFHHDDAVTADEVADLTEAEARLIYKTLFIERPGFDRIADDRLRAFLVDWGANSGPRTAVKALQRRLGVTADGIIGPQTARFANAADIRRLYDSLVDDRAQFYRDIVDADQTQAEYLRGWMNRVNEFRNVSWA